MSDKFSLKWNDFQSNVTKSFEAFRNEGHLHDVTLVSDDQNQVSAHKLVLSASSEYFNNIFKNNKVSNPFLCLEGVSLTDLNNILDYIYFGRIQIYQDDLDRFLSIAQRFKIEGLLGAEADNIKEEENLVDSFDLPLPKKQQLHQPKRKKEKMPDNTFDSINIPIQSHQPKRKKEIMPENTFDSADIPIQKMDSAYLNEIEEKLLEHIEENSDKTWSCKICNKIQPSKGNMKLHVETHMEGLSFPCNICGKQYRSRNVLRYHKSMKKHQ